MKKFALSFLALLLCLSLVACSVDQVLSDIDVVIQIAGSLGEAVGVVAPPDAAIVAVFTKLATDGINAIQNAYDTYKKSGATTDLQKVQAAVAAVNSNLTQELAAAKISDPVTQQKVAAWCNLIYSSVNAIAAALPQLGTSLPVSAPQSVKLSLISKKRTVAPPLPTPESLQARWAAEVCRGEAKCSKKVKAHRRHFWRALAGGSR